MQPLLRSETERKLEWVVGIEFSHLPERDRSVNQQLRMLIDTWRGREQTWRSEGYQKQKDRSGDYRLVDVDRDANSDLWEGINADNRYTIYERGTRRPLISEEVREGLEEIAAEEYSAVPVEELGFDELLGLVLEAWYTWATVFEVEWYPLREKEAP